MNMSIFYFKKLKSENKKIRSKIIYMKRYFALGLLILIIALGIFINLGHKTKTVNKITYNGSYIALGDSVSAGDGLTDYSDSSACNRSNQSYPYLVSEAQNLQLFNLSCSGATFAEGINGPQTVNQLTISSQINQLSNLKKPKLITITAGANDVGWIKYISSCYIKTCGSPEETALANSSIASLANSLTNTLNKISNKYNNSPPQVIVTSYYNPFPGSMSSCSDLTNLNQSSLNFLSSETTNLNSELASISTGYSFVKFEGLDFSGHGLCSSDPWVQGLTDGAPFHPNSAGQSYIASKIEMTYSKK